ncbi:sulfate transporter isoform X3 [Camelus ferus]|uniref:Sulfate transporter isoform X3 n=1 Tax=Camelus ferus TaxID=419612 RepID=A0A8B8SS69_CAMFR|nr:sulfate transporter isoform X3 [Camelus ferus]
MGGQGDGPVEGRPTREWVPLPAPSYPLGLATAEDALRYLVARDGPDPRVAPRQLCDIWEQDLGDQSRHHHLRQFGKLRLVQVWESLLTQKLVRTIPK